ncbi:IS66 family insertion sequence element accessory protein TnpA [Acetobacterium wieringae]|uniref:IS66 family insertion sequence element accessory protein TnpA n=1 Tax=Acetobacterium wieringae TaxID=52694 RepID=UPI00203351D2|nr:hypothetical protein [Acetobacterium wieringae]URN85234.1 hypothetical protein CHL1_000865 [Acetobacterium wieringae]
MDEITPVKTKFRMEQWTQLIQDQRSSGMTVKVWCQQNLVKETSYYYWLKRIRQQACGQEMVSTQLEPDEPVTFAKLPMSLGKTNRSPAVVINLPSATIEVMDGAAPETIEYFGWKNQAVRRLMSPRPDSGFKRFDMVPSGYLSVFRMNSVNFSHGAIMLLVDILNLYAV